MTVNLLELSQENLHIALVGSKMDVTSKAITNGDGIIATTDYLKNITLIGKNFKQEYKIITIYNALADGGLKWKTSDKDETVLEITFEAHCDPTDRTNSLWNGMKGVWSNITSWVENSIKWLTEKLSFWKSSSEKMSKGNGGGGVSVNVPCYDVGTPFVPTTGLALIHAGERCLEPLLKILLMTIRLS